MRELETLTHRDFEPCVGGVFAVAELGLELALLEAAAKPGSDGEGRRAFSLIFQGPPEPVLPQRIYRLECEALGALEIFLVPLGPAGGGMRYEAVFS